ncbi:hypothetical protein H8N03_21735 [Ramlibacter sp. USB13]|uniref:DUF2946 domain-containing protein n=1 Tax=Ramlibacter cellulosilyticus TaxID=2764187 RepID=A0A923SH51_9BURK|nr:hypothetical protein [Ramlibacter cellulosilyticus]MBC5785577.1 hypothetical protein [Ramlibacter cellulosilyticus]
MAFAAFRSAVRSRRFAWLLALALWLPVAQFAAASHALLHLHSTVTEQRDPASTTPGSCDLCVVAAALGSGAPAPSAPALATAAAPQAAPAAAPGTAVRATPPRFYASRAPPPLHA